MSKWSSSQWIKYNKNLSFPKNKGISDVIFEEVAKNPNIKEVLIENTLCDYCGKLYTAKAIKKDKWIIKDEYRVCPICYEKYY